MHATEQPPPTSWQRLGTRLIEGGLVRQLSPIEREKARILKRARAFIRLKHAEAADDELNEVLPRLEMEIDKAIQSGREVTQKQLEAFLGGE